MPAPLTIRQSEILEAICEHCFLKGYSPTVRELCRGFEIKNPNGIYCHLRSLIRKGWLSDESEHWARRWRVIATPPGWKLLEGGRLMPEKKADFPYPRTPTSAVIRVTFTNGEVYEIPAQVVADSRDENYADENEDTIGYIRERSLEKYDLIDWMSNNMNWEDLSPHARKVETPPQPFDYEGDWGNAGKTVVGEV